MKFFLIPVFLLLSFNCFSQQNIDESNIHSLRFASKLNKFNENSTNVNEYFETNFKEAKVDDFKEKEKLRYNAFLDQFEFLRDDNLYMMSKIPNSVVIFDNGMIFKYVTYIYKDNLSHRYLKALSDHDKNIVLYKKYEIDRTKPLGTNGYDKVNDIDENGYKYSQEEKIFFLKDGNLSSVPSNIKKLSEFLDINIEPIVKENKLNIKKEQDLIKLMEIINK